MTLDERKAAARSSLIADPTQSNRGIAREVGCSHEMVFRLRRRLLAEGLIADVRIKGADGKTYPRGRMAPTTYAGEAIKRVERLVAALTSTTFAETWGRTTPGTRDRLIRSLQRLCRVLDNLKHRVRRGAGPRPGVRVMEGRAG